MLSRFLYSKVGPAGLNAEQDQGDPDVKQLHRPHLERQGFNVARGNVFMSMGSGLEASTVPPQCPEGVPFLSLEVMGECAADAGRAQPHLLAVEQTETFIFFPFHFLKQLLMLKVLVASESLGRVPGNILFFLKMRQNLAI